MDLKRALQQVQKGATPARSDSPRAPLIEVFDSFQGEGRFVGARMLFVRVATCPLRCLYCDTPNSYAAPARFPVRFGVREAQEANPVPADRAAELVRQVAVALPAPGRPVRVSLTGGEPLVFPEFVKAFGRGVREHGMRLHLETAAIDPDALSKCIDQVDHLSADWKLPETLGPAASPSAALAPGQTFGERHRRCVEIAVRRGATVDVKIVLTPAVTDPSLELALTELAPLREKIVLVLQPVTPFGAVTRPLTRDDLQRHAAAALRAGFDVRVLPQTHKVLQLP
ncbi:MAG: 7-carboxy-7-deazaguanine synthase QueE [Planctomycetes bacterium]|nr:7-carboxy-7-deazaguanine synthase QueE [Planctomycetota bacterium]